MCRGGSCIAAQFTRGAGVTLDAAGRLRGVSVNSAPHTDLRQLAATLPHRRVGVSTHQDIAALGGVVIPAPTPNNPYHCTMSGITPQEAEALFTPTHPNPNRL